jgi:putative component of membrane protein insertase Oxa1/YidC/SpoIIIJ protein YidD
MRQNNYEVKNDTIDTNKQKSIDKAITIFKEQISKTYNRDIKRPNISIFRSLFIIVFFATIYLFCLFFAIYIAKQHMYSSWIFTLFINIIAFIILFIKLDSILIWLVLVYQRFAPDSLRRSCVFTPSCSEYMIESIKLKGAIKGLHQGIKRLSRCHYPNGGIDNP